MTSQFPEFEMSTEQAFGALVKVLIRQSVAATGTPGGRYNRLLDAEVLGFKVMHHAVSALALYRGVTIPELSPHPRFIDGFSVLGLARMCHESFLIFNHIFVTAQTEPEADFRYLAWRYVDTARQARFPAHSSEGRAMSESVQKNLPELQIELEKNRIFMALKESDRKKLIKEFRWPLLGWAKLGKEAGFNEMHAIHSYRYLCSYAHPGHLSVKQLRFAVGTEMQQHLIENGLHHSAVILACLAQDFPTVFPKCSGLIEGGSLEDRIIFLYSSFARAEHAPLMIVPFEEIRPRERTLSVLSI